MNAQANIVAVEQTNEEATLSERIADRIENAACAAYERMVCAAARVEVFAVEMTKVTPSIRTYAKSKAEQRMAERLAKYAAK